MTATPSNQEIILISPKITLLAFHLCKELTQEKPADAEEIWSNLAEVGKLLGIKPLQELPQLIADNASSLSNPPLLARDEKIPRLLLPNEDLENAPRDGLLALKGEIHPFRLSDTYCVDLTISPKSDRFPLNSLSEINPDGCLFPSYVRSSLGQTLLFFAQIADPNQNTEEISKKVLAQLIANSDRINADSFSLVAKGILLGGTIYEFTENMNNPRENIHILVWLATNYFTVAKEEKGNYYFPSINLLCAQKKIQLAYYQAREQYYKERRVYGQIEPIVREFSQWNSVKNQWLQTELKDLIKTTRNRKRKKALEGLLNESSTEVSDRVTAYLQKFNDRRLEDILKHLSQRQLEILEKRLVQIPTISVNYARCLRDIKTQLTTIQINRINYQTALKQLETLQPHTDSLGFLGKFISEDCDRFEQQIQYDLDYLASGKELFEPTIDSISSLVDIQAQKRQLANDLAEKERNRSIEVWVTVVASGLAVSSLSSNAMPKPVELLLAHSEAKDYQKTWYGNPASLLFLNVLFHSLIGILSAILVGIVARAISF